MRTRPILNVLLLFMAFVGVFSLKSFMVFPPSGSSLETLRERIEESIRHHGTEQFSFFFSGYTFYVERKNENYWIRVVRVPCFRVATYECDSLTGDIFMEP